MFALSGALRAEEPAVGAVYTTTNSPSGNAVLLFDRAADGNLTPAGSFPTGGAGTGTGLGNQGGLVVDGSDRWLFAINAGSNELSVFAIERGGLILTDKKPTGGVRPVSVTVHRGLVYVLNAGSDNLTALRVNAFGQLQPIAGSGRASSGTGTGAAQVQFSPACPPAASVTKNDGVASLVTASAHTNQTAACWVVVTNDGHFAYVSNTGSGTLTGFAIASDGRLQLLDADGHTADTGAAAIDLALSRGSQFLYSLNSGDGSISAFRVDYNGKLVALGTLPGLPAGANGLAAR